MSSDVGTASSLRSRITEIFDSLQRRRRAPVFPVRSRRAAQNRLICSQRPSLIWRWAWSRKLYASSKAPSRGIVHAARKTAHIRSHEQFLEMRLLLAVSHVWQSYLAAPSAVLNAENAR